MEGFDWWTNGNETVWGVPQYSYVPKGYGVACTLLRTRKYSIVYYAISYL
jgi:hypothetical protein